MEPGRTTEKVEDPPSSGIAPTFDLNSDIAWTADAFTRRVRWLPNYADGKVESEYVRYHHRYFTHIERGCLVVLFATATITVCTTHGVFLTAIVAAAAAVVGTLLIIDTILCHVRKPCTVFEQTQQAILHEYLFFAAVFLWDALIGVVSYPAREYSLSNDVYVGSSSQEERRRVVTAVYRYPPLIIGMCVVSGRPRFFLVFLCAVAYLITTYSCRSLAPVDSEETMALVLTLDIVIAGIILACQYMLEVAQRKNFESYALAFEARNQAISAKSEIDMFMVQLLPPMLYNRLTSREVYEDSSPCATVLIVSITNLSMWVSANTLEDVMRTVSRVSGFVSLLSSLSKAQGLQRVRVSADQVTVVGNLLFASMSHAITITALAAKARDVAKQAGIPVRSAIHSGPMKGSVAGSTFIRYEVWGECIVTATAMLSAAPEGGVVLSQLTLGLLRDRVAVAPIVCCSDLPVPCFLMESLLSARMNPASLEGCDYCGAAAPLHSDESSAGSSELAQGLAAVSERHVHFAVNGDSCGVVAIGVEPVTMPSLDDATVVAAGDALSQLSEPLKKLEIVSTCTWGLKFADAEEEKSYLTACGQPAYAVHSLALICLFSAVCLCLAVVEVRGCTRSRVAGVVLLCVVIVLCACCCVCLGFGLLHALETVLGYILFWLFIVLLIFGVAYTGPAVPANSPTVIALVCTCLAMTLSVAQWQIVSIVNAAAILFPTLLVGYLLGPQWTSVAVITMCTFAVGFPLTVRWRELSERQRYRDARIATLAAHIEESERDRLESALAGFIPTSLLQFVSREIAVNPSWRGISICIERGIVVVVVARGAVLHVPTRDAPAQAESASSPFVSPLESLVEGLQHLSLTKVLGDSVQCAGPLSPSCLQLAVVEAQDLVASVDRTKGQCRCAVTFGVVFAVVTGGTNEPTFFLMGAAVHEAKEMLRRHQEADGAATCVRYSEPFLKQL